MKRLLPNRFPPLRRGKENARIRQLDLRLPDCALHIQFITFFKKM